MAIFELHKTSADVKKKVHSSEQNASDRASAGMDEWHTTTASVARSSKSGWKLPFREELIEKNTRKSTAALKEEFRRLDILGEGRLNYLNLKSALEIREVDESDSRIRNWLREYDRNGKGYIDFKDYLAIHEDLMIGSKTLPTSNSMKSLGTIASSSHSDAVDRSELLKKAFDRYDVDRDGFITTRDLNQAFTAQGKSFTQADLDAWVQSRDSTGSGAVSFADFLKHYK